MKKLFFFRSSSNNGNHIAGSSTSNQKQVYQGNSSESGLNNQDGDKTGNSFRSQSPKGVFSKSRKQGYDSPSTSCGSALRRSRSLSSTAFGDGQVHSFFSCTTDENRSPSSSTNGALQHQCKHSSRRPLTRQKEAKAKQSELTTIHHEHGLEMLGSSASPKFYYDSSSNSNSSSSNVSSKVLDRYIDGEQQQEGSKPKNSSSQRHHSGSGNDSGRLPPWIHHTAPTSPTDSVKDKPGRHSFREAKGTRLHFASRDLVEQGFGHESPRSLAKNVIERLSQAQAAPKSSSKEFDNDIPITIEDVYSGSANRCYSNLDVPAQKYYSLEEPYETFNHLHGNDFSGFQRHNSFLCESTRNMSSFPVKDMTDAELQRRSKEAEERVVMLSDQLEHESFPQDNEFDLPSVVQIIRNLAADRVSLAIEVSGLLKSRISERDSAKEELRLAKAEMESCTRRLEKEKSELQSALEKELDRRSSDWSSKLEKYRLEEQRLRERVRELAEQNVSLQREISSFSQRETENRSAMKCSEQQLGNLTARVEELSMENQDLKQSLSELKEHYSVAEENIVCIKNNLEQKDKECIELQKSITRLLRTRNDQEKTITGLQEVFSKEIEKQPSDKFDKHVATLQIEQMRFAGVELALRREVESYRLEVDSLRNENVNLLKRLKDNGKEIDAQTFKLDSEMQARVCCLQNQGLTMLNESTYLCSKLLEYIKRKAGELSETSVGGKPTENGLDGHFLLDFDLKVNGLKRGTESLTRSLQTISSLLQEKSSLVASKPQTPCISGSGKLNHGTSEQMSFELKAERLLTSLLREKLYSKDLEVERLQAELAAAVRGNDILRCEVQNALDSVSSGAHKLKDLEFQMLKKDENINRLQSYLQECTKELTKFKGILPKVSEERDLMWEEVKQYNEKNIFLNSEVNLLKKKIEALDEDILLKEGQITILKDTLGNRPFGLLASLDSPQDFLLK